jgi:hypothetical protein
MSDNLMRRGYIHRWEKRDASESYRTDYWFCEFAKDGAYWDTREAAQHACDIFNLGIEIRSAHGGIHVCRNFEVEEVSAIHFVVFCEAPFVVTNTSGTSTENV